MNPAMNDIFVKTTKMVSGITTRPAWNMALSRATVATVRVPLLRDALVDNKAEIERVTVDELAKRIDKLR